MAYTINEQCTGCGACVRICPADAVSGEKKMPHRIDAGSCIECGACGRVCPHGSVADAAGKTCIRVKRTEWPKPLFDFDRCLACITCIEACPAGSLGFSGRLEAGVRHNYPNLENEGKSCIGCGLCVQACPVDAIVLTS
jgi:Na+-translocating ferredoxin:NAD+ oxidoreductase subunit B